MESVLDEFEFAPIEWEPFLLNEKIPLKGGWSTSDYFKVNSMIKTYPFGMKFNTHSSISLSLSLRQREW